ncbi:CRISPR-associated protein Csx14 [Nannocystis exedens]|uniref:CRISPR-associated protein Csx14 n=1 Tax=Nannocystis exedens TaxID=54 RepID=A0A1I2ID94_9BACT|nr:type I-U CRISPR-associated protein Cas8c [Nannocystis exedens]PCC68196.1 type I-U CRISPR-associated protein Cas8c [Nannocystis exedens]SFF39618.1 CRISPR-associated protein Csx14 [Nannocystis exedens]
MADASIPVDLFNPGQVFACLGIVEAAATLLGEAEAAFDWTGESRFHVRSPGPAHPIAAVLAFLADAEVVAEVPHESTLATGWKSGWGRVESLGPVEPYPYPEPGSVATLRAALCVGSRRLVLDHWGDVKRDNVKFWAGSGGYPGAALARDALALVRDRLDDAVNDPFAVAAPQSSSFRLDWRRDYIPMEIGFSLNEHGGRIETVGYPLVELLGALGLGHARPQRLDRLAYRYGALGRTSTIAWYPPCLLRAALGGAPLPFPLRRFHMSLGWPGQEGQARSITTVIEESPT